MNQNGLFRSASSFWLILPCACVLILASGSGLSADDESAAPHHGHPPLHAQDTMRAFKAADQQSSQNLSAMSMADCVDGLAGGVYPCGNVDLLAFLPLDQIGGG